MNVPVLSATSLQRILYSGRTKPGVFFCEDETGEKNGEYVVKLKAGMDNKENGLIGELIASQIANVLDIPAPEIDHEMGFSFIYEILPLSNPWQITTLGFMKNHLFYGGLKGQPINLDRFGGALELLSDTVMAKITANVPEEWQNNNIQKIENHINEITHHINDFVDEVRRILQ